MPIPAGITSITVTGKYLAPDGSALSGYVVFTPSIKAADSTDNAIVPIAPYKKTLDANGAFSVALMSTDDPQWNAPGWTYEVLEVITTPEGVIKRDTYNIEVPAASAGGLLDLADVPIVPVPGTPSPYLQKTGGTMTGDLNINGTAKVVFSTDTNLYRAAADTLKTDDSLHISGTFRHLGTSLGFYNATTVTKPTVTGSKGANAALTSLLTALANLGLITDSSS